MQNKFLRFLASGVVNTLASYALYFVLLKIINYQLAYSLAYIAGIGFSYFMQRYYVFNASGGAMGPVLIILIYFIQYALGFILVSLWVKYFNFPVIFAPLFSIAVSVPITYALSRNVFRYKKIKS